MKHIVLFYLLVVVAIIANGSTNGLDHTKSSYSDDNGKVKATDLPDIVVMGYNSYDAPIETLIFSSIHENENRNIDGSDENIISVGLGQHLWAVDEHGPELKRGWMYRLRLMIQYVKEEYEQRRNRQDFIVIVADALDVMVAKGATSTLDQVRDRFMNDFDQHKIVFSTQIYCCNPWEIREFARRDWDTYYKDSFGNDNIPSMYKHLNAGTYMGYASAILQMADEMMLWNTTYHRHESYHSLVGLESTKNLHMSDLEVDDDEWQLATWFFQDQKKDVPLAALDHDQNIFGVTGTFRAQESNDDTYIVFSKEHFYTMFGSFPETVNANTFMDQSVVCPYEYDSVNMGYTNTMTGGHPLIFHFAGNEWICACRVFAETRYQNIPPKFRNNCEQRYEFWSKRVDEGIRYIAQSSDTTGVLWLHGNVSDITTDVAIQEERRLNSIQNEEDRKFGSQSPYGFLERFWYRLCNPLITARWRSN